MTKTKKPNRKPKNFAELKPTERAIADQSVRDVLLAIVVAQGKTITIPIADLDRIAADNRLLLEVDRNAGVVKLRSESFAAKVIADAKAPALIN